MEVEGKLSIHSTSKEEKGEVIHKVCDENEDSQGGSWTTFPFVIATVLGLTVAAGGWGANLIVFLITKFNVKTITATKINNIILGTNNLFPIAGAFIADSFFTTFSVVGAFSFISLLGVIMLTLIATIPSLRPSPCPIGSLITCQAPSKLQYSALYVALSLASLGLGGTRFTIATMGADQFNNPTDQGVFFNWYFVALYMAIVFSGTAIVYIQDNVGWGLGFGICCIANGIGLGVFSLGKRFYKQVKPKGSPFLSIARVLVAAVRKRKMSSRTSTEPDYYYGAGANANAMTDNPPTTSLSFLNCAALKIEDDKQFEGSYGNPWGLCTVEEVEDLKTVIKIMPLWSTGIFVSTPIAIICSLTILQALTMDRHLGPHFEIPAATFLVFTLFSTAICIFIIDRFILLKYKNLTGQTLTSIQRIGIGHIINIMSFAGAALVERRRLGVVRAHSLMNQPGSEVPMSALWLVAPLSVLGLAESFHFPGQVSLCYQEFPKSLRSTSTAMISLLLGIGYYLCTAVTDLVDKTTNWLPDDINQGRLDNVYWMLVVIGVVNFGYYMTCAKVFVSQNQNVVK
ncbi:PREDICTED: protein NRT1/ PTR FAMILY 2.7-like [Fragaria vesca subsp. vesca]|uniref:protein NRT1/ PTR FAMILY 2.7-like n=1 Tax=Fragaria vesca subsp. vesca TaxID=101020 RepID=UPI0002C326C1|nr:PREDICTED: protein NRT1/ PTR FAMILY 2.7-like [Fragaria vesca subsp. vesca]